MRIPSLLIIVMFAAPLSAQTLEQEVRALREEIQRLREELNAVKDELRARADTVEQMPLVQAQIQEHAQTKVETTSKFPMKVFGTIVSNTFWNTAEPNWLDVPNIATPYAPDARTGSFTSTLRQTRIGASLDGPQIGSMKASGFFAMDFFGGIPNFQTGQVMGLPRLLYAYIRLDGEKTAVQVGQDHMLLAPRNPTTLAGMSFPTLYRSGNLYLRVPQLRAERSFGQLRIAGGLGAPVAGDFRSETYEFAPPNLSGERSRTPAFQGRISWSATPAGPYEKPQWEFGASGHYSRERLASGTDSSWAAAVDFDATVDRFGVGGELFVGRNLDAFGGSVAQIAKSAGGFIEGRIAATRQLSFNGGFGKDRLFDAFKFPVALSQNSTVFANTIYQFTPEFGAAFEFQRLRTEPLRSAARKNKHFNLTFAYSF